MTFAFTLLKQERKRNQVECARTHTCAGSKCHPPVLPVLCCLCLPASSCCWHACVASCIGCSLSVAIPWEVCVAGVGSREGQRIVCCIITDYSNAVAMVRSWRGLTWLHTGHIPPTRWLFWSPVGHFWSTRRRYLVLGRDITVSQFLPTR